MRKHKCQPIPTARLQRVINLEHLIASWYCGDYDDNPAQKGALSIEKCIAERNEAVAHIKKIDHCLLCGYPK